jgi:isopentenyl-diphosphate delta-isomerase
MRTLSRKDEHLAICLEGNVEGSVTTGFERVRLPHRALPEIDLEDVALETTILGKKLSAPLLIAGMTGGTEKAAAVNRVLARAARRTGVGLGLGSARALLERPETAWTFDVREDEQQLIVANLGAAELLRGRGRPDLEQVMDACRADAIALHLNALQEAVQPEGSPCFRGLRQRLREVVPLMDRPVILKETGSGFSEEDARAVLECGAAGVDVSGAGGTSWARVEGRRGGPARSALGETFAGWGIPTAESVLRCRRVLPKEKLVIASGGVTNGLEAAKALALGADAVAVARPFLVAANDGEDALVAAIEQLVAEMRVALFCAGAPDAASLRRTLAKEASEGGEP